MNNNSNGADGRMPCRCGCGGTTSGRRSRISKSGYVEYIVGHNKQLNKKARKAARDALPKKPRFKPPVKKKGTKERPRIGPLLAHAPLQTKLCQELIEKVCNYIREGNGRNEASLACWISKSSLHTWMNKGHEILALVRRMREAIDVLKERGETEESRDVKLLTDEIEKVKAGPYWIYADYVYRMEQAEAERNCRRSKRVERAGDLGDAALDFKVLQASNPDDWGKKEVPQVINVDKKVSHVHEMELPDLSALSLQEQEELLRLHRKAREGLKALPAPAPVQIMPPRDGALTVQDAEVVERTG